MSSCPTDRQLSSDSKSSGSQVAEQQTQAICRDSGSLDYTLFYSNMFSAVKTGD